MVSVYIGCQSLFQITIIMKYPIFLWLATLCVSFSCQSDKTSETSSELNNSQIEETMQSSPPPSETRKLRHVVLFKFKEGTDPEAIATVETAFAELSTKISEIKSFEWGLNNSPEGLEKGFTHCFLVTLDSEEGRDIYLPHPDHQAFVKLLDGILEDVLVVDYWTGE